MTIEPNPGECQSQPFCDEYRRRVVALEQEKEDLREVLAEIVRISDRKHDAWDRARALLRAMRKKERTA